MAELSFLPRPPRTPRAWWKTLLHWVTGCVSDPHTRATSSCRIIALSFAYSLHRYLVGNPTPDWKVVSVLVTGGIIPLVLRTKSTQKPELLLPRPPIVLETPEAT